MRHDLTGMLGVCLASTVLLAACGSQPVEQSNDSFIDTDAVTSADTPDADVPAAGESSQAAMQAPVQQAAGDPIRGPGGLEQKCLARVADETGATVNGTNRIEESEAAIEIYVNVDGAQAPWKCLGYKDGTIAEVSFTGDEGAL